MPKPTEYTDLLASITLTFNQEVVVVEDDAASEKYVPVVIIANAVAVTDDGGRRDVMTTANLGNPRGNPLTLKQIHTLLTQHATPLAAVFKELVQEALSEDVGG